MYSAEMYITLNAVMWMPETGLSTAYIVLVLREYACTRKARSFASTWPLSDRMGYCVQIIRIRSAWEVRPICMPS
jgi:hypothetical protein